MRTFEIEKLKKAYTNVDLKFIVKMNGSYFAACHMRETAEEIMEALKLLESQGTKHEQQTQD